MTPPVHDYVRVTGTGPHAALGIPSLSSLAYCAGPFPGLVTAPVSQIHIQSYEGLYHISVNYQAVSLILSEPYHQ